MIPFSLREIASVLNAHHIGVDCIIHAISIRSNCIDQQCMFIALLGKRVDGHDFARQSVINGAKALLVNRYLLLDIPQLIVIDTHCALIKLASWVCQKSSAQVIVITGSSGKTSVKEMTASILKNCGRVIATKNNLNNTIGVPMTLLRLTKKDNFAIIELGISVLGEIDKLIKVISIDVALVNNIFPAHISGLKSLAVIRQEKGKIYLALSVSGIGIVNFDNHALFLWDYALQGKTIWKFSIHKKIGVDFFTTNIIYHKNGIQFVLHTPFGISTVFLPMLGLHSIANALAASALAFSVGATLSHVIYGLNNFKILPGRLYPIFLGKGKLLLDDTYNSNIGSMVSAIRVLHKLSGYKILITSDMLELGEEFKSIEYHCYIGRYIKTTNIDQVLTIGNISFFVFKFCGKTGRHFQNKVELISYLETILFKYKLINILVKGSRSFKMETVIHAIKGRSICYFG